MKIVTKIKFAELLSLSCCLGLLFLFRLITAAEGHLSAFFQTLPLLPMGAGIMGSGGSSGSPSEKKEAEKDNKERNSFLKNPDINLEKIIDIPAIQAIMDDFYDLTRIGAAVIDLKGRVLVSTGWQEICTKFHRKHPETKKHCKESDTCLTKNVPQGTYKLYKCKNGMWDVVAPIYIGGEHAGNILTEQFFFEGEEIDYKFFRKQAKKYKFDREEYLKALEKVQRHPRERVEKAMEFYIKLASLIGQLSYSNMRFSHLFFHDNLTGLFNRRYLKEEMRKRNGNEDLPLSVIICDINGLQLINNAYGPEIGDQLLKETAAILKKSSGRMSTIARWGGDEFAILLPETSHKATEKICSRIASRCRGVKVKGSIPLSISLGNATKDDNKINNVQLLSRAEDNMHRHKLSENKSARSAVLTALMKTLGEKSYETEEHARRLRNMALKVGKRYGLSQTERDKLAVLVSLHDIGKITIEGNILTKSGDLTPEEMEEIRKHPETGARIASLTEEFAPVAKDILFHHERWDGKGYPMGLKKTEIPLLARIAAVVDAYDVMTSGRSYQKPLSRQQALRQLKVNASTQFDPDIVDVFVSLVNEGQIN